MEKVSQWIKKHAQRISVHVFVSYLEVQELVAQELGDGRSSRSCPSIAPPALLLAWQREIAHVSVSDGELRGKGRCRFCEDVGGLL